MQLEPGERSILASFMKGPEAEKARDALQAAGYSAVQLDHIAPWGYDPDADQDRPAIRGKESSLVDAVLEPATMDDDTRILMNATNEASGMAGANTTFVPPFLITVVTNDQRLDAAVSILKRHGGRV